MTKTEKRQLSDFRTIPFKDYADNLPYVQEFQENHHFFSRHKDRHKIMYVIPNQPSNSELQTKPCPNCDETVNLEGNKFCVLCDWPLS